LGLARHRRPDHRRLDRHHPPDGQLGGGLTVAVFGILFFLVGAAFVYLGVRTPADVDESDPGTYLRSLDEPEPEGDEFDLLLQEPFITRVLRPLAARMQGIVSGALPGNYRDNVHEQLVYAGLTTK